jgi:hypothetical protein
MGALYAYFGFMRPLRALLFALIINLQTLAVLWQVGPLSPFAFSGVDESSYLPLSIAIAEGRSETYFYKELDTEKGLGLLDTPTAMLDYVIGNIAVAFKFSSAELGLLLDIFCAFVGYLLFSRFYRFFVTKDYFAELASLLTLVQPKLFALDYWFLLQPHLGEHVLNVPIGTTSALAISRAVYTQISYLVFPLVLIALAHYLLGKKLNKTLIVAGLLAGASVNIYVFCWIAVSALLFVTLLLAGFSAKTPPMQTLKELCIVAVSIFIGSLLGLYSILWGASGARLIQAEEFGQYWYFSPEVFSVCLLLIGTLYFYRSITLETRIACCLLLACFILQLVLMNLQPVLGVFISPMRFVQLYLQPVSAGILCIICLQGTARFNSKPLLVVISGVFVMLAFAPLFQRQAIALELTEGRIETPLAEFINKNVEQDAVLSIWPSSVIFDELPSEYPLRLRPNIIAAFTGRYLLSQNWIMFKQLSSQQIAEREILQSWLFTGEPKEAFDCQSSVPLPGDILHLTWTMNTIARRDICSVIQSHSKNICDLLGKYEVDYILYDIPGVSVPNELSEFTEAVWTSASGDAVLHAFARNRFLNDRCP